MKNHSLPWSAFVRRNLLALVLALFLLCGFSAQTEDEIIYPQPVQITVMENGNYKLSFEGDVGVNECWAWFFCPDKDSPEDLMEVMRGAIAEGTPARSLEFDGVFSTWPVHGTKTIPSVEVPADSLYVFYGKMECGVHSFDKEQKLFVISMGGTNLSKIKPGDVGGNGLLDGSVIPPKTGDTTNPFLLTALLAVSALGFAVLIKRSKKSAPSGEVLQTAQIAKRRLGAAARADSLLIDH